MIIKDLLARDLSQKIEEIIKLYQIDEDTVYREITEYVATERICKEYHKILKAIAEAPSDPHEGIGVWISGFFGSGKSSFAKNLGYILSNREIHSTKASELFKSQLNYRPVSEIIDFINRRIPSEVIMFDISVDRNVKKATEKISEIMYSVFLRELDYAQDFDIAELEIELEGEGKLSDFISLCEKNFNIPWSKVRKGAQKNARASAILHIMDPSTYPSADSWAKSIGSKQTDITVGKFVERIFELSARRRPGKAIVFIIDEVGQYVARSADKIEDLRAVVEQIGKESKNRLKAKSVISPVWVIVTSQEKLDEVVAAIDSKRVELAKLQDRFKYRIDMSPSDISEVATKRVLAKKDEANSVLSEVFQKSEGILNSACRLERTSRKTDISEEGFINFYPYLPHFIDLSIDIMSGIRNQAGADKQMGGSNRTIIKQAHEMLVSDRTDISSKSVGQIVSLDLIFELVEGNISSEKQKDINDIIQRFKSCPQDGYPVKVAKAICLLEFVRDLPRTENNIAALLVGKAGNGTPLPEVQKSLSELLKAQFIKNTEDGYKLQTAQEKNWETEKRSYLEPKPAERNKIKREVITEVFSDPKLKSYRFKDLKTFKVGLSVDGVKAGGDEQICISMMIAEDSEEFSSKLNEARGESRKDKNKNEIYWVMMLNSDIYELLQNLYASRQMVFKYDQLRAQNKITQIELDCLNNEKAEEARIKNRLREKFSLSIMSGSGLFRGTSKDGSILGKTIYEIFKKFLDLVIPELYPKLEMAARSLKGTEAEEILKAANLNGLSAVFYGGESGLNLVVKKDDKFVPNPSSDIASEILSYIKYEHEYGNTVTGKILEEHFQGTGYGWDRDILRLVLAVLLRAGAIEITYQGRRYTGHHNPMCRTPLTNNAAFKSTSFAPKTSVSFKTLKEAAENYEAFTGDTVEDVEESAIAQSFKKLAEEEIKQLHSLEAVIDANNLPLKDIIEDYKETLKNIINSSSDDCVIMLAGEGKSFGESRNCIKKIRKNLDSKGLKVIKDGRAVLEHICPVLENRTGGSNLQADDLRNMINSKDFYEHTSDIKNLIVKIFAEYKKIYSDLHSRRSVIFDKAIEEIKSHSDWIKLSDEMQSIILKPLTSRICNEINLLDMSLTCSNCKASIAQMEADMAKIKHFTSEAIFKIQKETAPKKVIKRIRVSEFFPSSLETEEAIDEAVDKLREHLRNLVLDGISIIFE